MEKTPTVGQLERLERAAIIMIIAMSLIPLVQFARGG
jgi:hypothetical protein